MKKLFHSEFIIILCLFLFICFLCQNSHCQPDDIILQPGDTLDITVLYYPDFNMTVMVREDYKIFYPFLPDAIDVKDKNIAEIKEIITEGLKSIIKDPQVSINISGFARFEVYISGEVETPGKYDINRNSRILEVLVLSGLTEKSDLENVTVLREDKRLILNVRKVLDGKDMSYNIMLEDRDVIYVYESEKTVTVTGAVNSPGSYVIKKGMNTLMHAIDLAGGPAQNEFPNTFTLLREGQAILTNNLDSLYRDGNMEENLELHGGDIILIVSQEKPKLYISVSGEVMVPGIYEIKEGDRILEAILLAGGLQEESEVELGIIIRKSGEEIPVNLEDLMINGNMAENYPVVDGDTLIIAKPGKKVLIAGAINNPGIYYLEENSRVLDAFLKSGAYQRPKLEIIAVGRVVDGEMVVWEIETDLLYKEPTPEINFPLEKGDVVFIPEIEGQNGGFSGTAFRNILWSLTSLVNLF